MKIKKIFKNPFFWGFILGIAALHIIKEMALNRRHAPDPMFMVPDWELTNQMGEPFGQKDLLGKIVVADFFFTSCPTICPKLTASMKEIHQRFLGQEEKVHFISISVDPERDQPLVLKEFMEKNQFAFSNWHSLTGEKEQIYDVVVNKMKAHLGEKEALPDAPGVYDIPHLGHLALFDQKGALRGLFKTEAVEMAALVRAIKFLLEEP